MALSNNIKKLILVDGLPTTSGSSGNEIRYKTVTLRETTVADERRAAEMSERALLINGAYQLLPSEEVYAQAMAMLGCEKFECEGHEPIDRHVMDLDLFGKLSRYDLQAIQERVALLEAAAQLRHGLITDEQFLEMQTSVMGEQQTKQPTGQAEDVGQADSEPVPIIERVPDNAGNSTQD
jgi:phage FluMu protein gp41